ncbi:MAG TPA: lysophospholipid acyltransferase family protein [Acidimicrobiales bacterium]|jgi:1-acyl-sn-glycerol-3-phosphate acyltransferase|nr:lysophospholipid acyltransferase family protein [Acidimicrobiales bacterium]
MRVPARVEAVVRRPPWPGTVPRPPVRRDLGVDYDTAWSRRPPARFVRALLLDNVTRPLTYLATRPKVLGSEHLAALRAPVIFAANHTSHLDTAIVLSALPARFRHRAVVAAAADYFFDRAWKARLWPLLLGTIPMERTKVNRRSADLAAELLGEGWSLVIFPEGGRSPDGWGQEFRGGAAYLAKRCGVPVVPIHLKGVRPLLPKGRGTLRPGTVEVRFGSPLSPLAPTPGGREEDARRFAARIEAAVAALADEAESDWWSARRRAARGTTPAFRGPQAAAWRRAWALAESARRDRPRQPRGSAKPW